MLNLQITSLKERESISTISQRTSKSVRALKMHKPTEVKMLVSEIWQQTKLLCRPPHLRNTVLTCAIQFCLTTRWTNLCIEKHCYSLLAAFKWHFWFVYFSYYTLMIWFPELFNRFEEFESQNPNQSASVCDVSSVVLEADING